MLLALALGALAALLALMAPSTTVTGRVGAFGGGGGGCYPTVSYEVDGESYRFTAERDRRWCVLDMGGDAVVFYDPDAPAQGRLSRYGDRPADLLRAALVALVLAALVATWGVRGDPRRLDAAPASEVSRTGHWGRVPRVVAWVLVLGWALTSVAVVLSVDRTRSLGDLEAAIYEGRVDEVLVAGELGPGSNGSAAVELRWSVRGLRYVTEARQLQGSEQQIRRLERQSASTLTSGDDTVLRAIRGDLTTYLTSLDPDVRVEQTYRTLRAGGLSYESFGWTIRGWLLWPFIALLAVTLRLLAISPAPWRATRWAWFWLVMGLAPLGALAFLLLGGPTGAARRPSPQRRDLNGWWAFVLVLLLTGEW